MSILGEDEGCSQRHYRYHVPLAAMWDDGGDGFLFPPCLLRHECHPQHLAPDFDDHGVIITITSRECETQGEA